MYLPALRKDLHEGKLHPCPNCGGTGIKREWNEVRLGKVYDLCMLCRGKGSIDHKTFKTYMRGT